MGGGPSVYVPVFFLIVLPPGDDKELWMWEIDKTWWIYGGRVSRPCDRDYLACWILVLPDLGTPAFDKDQHGRGTRLLPAWLTTSLLHRHNGFPWEKVSSAHLSCLPSERGLPPSSPREMLAPASAPGLDTLPYLSINVGDISLSWIIPSVT